MSTPRERAVASVFFALSDETRLGIVKKLGATGALSATALAEGATVSRQAIAKHLQVLEGAGLVTPERHGREVRYTLDPATLDDARSYLDRMSARWDTALERLRRMVETPPTQASSRPKR